MNMCDVCYKHATKNTEVDAYRVKFVHPTKRGTSITHTRDLCPKCATTVERRVNVMSIKARSLASV